MGMNKEGGIARAMGWSYLFDDEGGGYWIGARILNAIFREFDGRDGSTGLRDLIFKWFQVNSYDGILEKIYGSKNPVVAVASVIKAVKNVWTQNPTVYKIVMDAIHELVKGIRALARKLDLKPPVRVYYNGVVFSLGDKFVELFSNELKKYIGFVEVSKPIFKPVFGAILYAMRLEDIRLNKRLLKRLYSEEVKQGVLT